MAISASGACHHSLAGSIGAAACALCGPSCLAEQAKPVPDGAAAEAAALKFEALSAGDVASFSGQMTTAGRAAATDAQIAGTLKGLGAFGVIGVPTLTKAYMLNVNPAPAAIGFVPCGEGVVTYAILLQVEDGAWRVAAFHVGPSLMAGRTGSDWWEVAKKQRQECHDFTAALTYATARNLLYRGPNYTGPMFVSVMQDARTLPVPKELSGPFPMTWTMDGRTFKIAQVSPTGTSGGRSVLALVQLSDFADNKDADRQNHVLIDAFDKVHPEWREVFDWLAAKTCKPDGKSERPVGGRNSGTLLRHHPAHWDDDHCCGNGPRAVRAWGHPEGARQRQRSCSEAVASRSLVGEHATVHVPRFLS